jgi:CubicO group peptidase (beta-lactamase class C family)
MSSRVFWVLWVLILTVTITTRTATAQALADDPRVASALRLIQVWMEAQIAYDNIPGASVAIARDQDIVWSGGFGYADVERRTPAKADTIYGICSISKLFTSIGVMQLRDQGRLRLDEPIAKYLPWFNIKQAYPQSGPVTLNAILTHSSGLPREADFPYWTGPEHSFPTREQIITKLATQEMLYPADTYSQYSNLGLTLAGEIVAAISGEPYPAYVQKRILGPLGLKETTPEIPEQHKGGRLATPYAARTREGARRPLSFYQVRGLAPAAGYASTGEDLVRFAAWQLRLLEKGGEDVLTANTLREMHRIHWIDDSLESARGLGFGVQRRGGKQFVGHGGNCPGYRTNLSLSLDDKVAVAVMMNAEAVNPGSYGRVIYEIMAPAIKKALDGPGQPKSVDPSLSRYIGRYTAPLGSERQVLIFDGELAILSLPTENPQRSLMKLRRVGDNAFRRIRDDGVLGEPVDFELGQDGRVTRFKHENNFSYRVEPAGPARTSGPKGR